MALWSLRELAEVQVRRPIRYLLRHRGQRGDVLQVIYHVYRLHLDLITTRHENDNDIRGQLLYIYMKYNIEYVIIYI